MGERITSKWTSSLTEAFGDTPQIRKAIAGEELWESFARKAYDEVINHKSDRSKQIAGADFTIKKSNWRFPVTVDVKTNLNNRTFFVENISNGWLRSKNKQTIRIVHLDIVEGWVIQYDRIMMIKYLDSKNITTPLVKLSVFDPDINVFARRYRISLT